MVKGPTMYNLLNVAVGLSVCLCTCTCVYVGVCGVGAIEILGHNSITSVYVDLERSSLVRLSFLY